MPTKERIADDARLAQLDNGDVWEGEAEAQWQPDDGPHLVFPVTKISISGGKRIQERERPGRRGARLTTTGAKARRIQLVIPLENSVDGTFSHTLYPDMRDALDESFEREETGTLLLPMHDAIRCKASDFSYEEDADGHVSATVYSGSWIADNEEVVVASSFQRATIRTQGRRLADRSEFTLQRDSVWDGSLADVNELVSELEGIVAIPETTAQDVATRTRIIGHAIDRAIAAFSTGEEEGSRLLFDPLNSASIRTLILMQDTAAGADAEARAGQRRTTRYLVDRPRTLQSIAVELRQSYPELIQLNQYAIEDPTALEDGDVIRVFEVNP